MSVERPSPPPANTVSRRTFLRTLGIAGGGGVVAPAFVRTPASAQETPSPLRPDPTAKRGGTLRYAVHNAPAHFDVHQSRTVATIGDMVVLDPHKIEFRLTEPRPRAFMLAAFASGWNIIVRKKTLDEHGGNLRQVMNYPCTGPFRHVSRKDKEIWIMERNPDYWNKGLPYIDRLEVYHMFPFSPELGSDRKSVV